VNPPGSRFCDECGHNLIFPSEPSPKDLSLDEKLAKIQRYLPEGLTEKILAQRGKIEGERKQVTVMFCDMEGFTALSERLGPEEAYSIMDEVYEFLIHKVHDYEGTVNEMTGDGIMALFGAPIALEDAPQRAIRSAMAIHREMGRFSDKIKQEKEGLPPLKMRIGIHTGPVVVGTLGNDLRVEFKAVGDTVNLASRMEGLAEPGRTYVSDETFRLTEGFFRFEALGEKEVKGKEELVKTYRVIAPSPRRTRFDVSAERGLTPFVGRERELDLLLDGFERSREGRGQAVSIVAEAGFGKSRLLYEFRKAVANEDVTFLEGRCLSYSRSVAYHPVIDILKSNFDIQEGDEDSQIREKVKRGLKVVGADEASTLPYLLELLSVKDSGIDKIPMSPEAKKERIIETLNRIVLKGSEIRSVVMAIEDLHWIDKSSEERFKSLLDCISGARVFLIFTYRPEFVHTWGGKSYHSQLNLNRLSNRESLAIMTYLLGTEEIETDLEELILEKTEGVPFFIEELVKSLKDLQVIERKDNACGIAKDIKTVTIPSTIQDVIMARVDTLPDEAKGVLQTGSVVGREFSHELIQRITGRQEQELLSYLSVLKDSELIYERGIYPESTYIFKHAFTQEVAYETLLLERRKVLHGLVGEAIEGIYQERIEEQVDLLYHHFSLAENWPKAVRYGRQAAEKATRLSHFHEAVTMLEQVQPYLFQLPEDQSRQEVLIDVLLQQERLCETLGQRERQQAIINQIISLLQPAGDLARLAEVYVRQGDLYTLLRRFTAAAEALDKSLRISRDLSDPIGERNALRSLGLLCWHEGKNEEALERIEEVLNIDRQQEDTESIVGDLANLGSVLRSLEDYERARTCLEEGLQLCEVIQNPIKQSYILQMLGNIHRSLGKDDEAIVSFQRAAKITEQNRLPIHQSYHLTSLAHIYFRQGRIQESLQLYEQAIDVSRKAKHAEGLSQSLRMLGEVLLGMDRQSEALPHFHEAATIFARLKDDESEALVWSNIATAQEREENYPDAIAAWEKVRTLRKAANNSPGELEAIEGMARVTRKQADDPARTLQYYGEALYLADELNDRNKQGDLLNTMGILEWQQGAYKEAVSCYERALKIFQELDDQVHQGLVLNSLGVTLTKLNRHEEALNRLEEALKLHCQTKELLLQGHALAALGEVYYEMGKSDEALHRYEMSLKIRQDIGDRKGEGWMMYHLARVNASQGAKERARDYVNQASKIAKECKDGKLQEICSELENSKLIKRRK
jgi:class 3 adenylate cyclase/tetratricopeptide (TPR) repeat protein